MLYCPTMQISLDDVRAVARLLEDHNLSEISVESTGDPTQLCRLAVRRALLPAPGLCATAFHSTSQTPLQMANGDAAAATLQDGTELSAGQSDVPSEAESISITATAVGVFRTATPTLQEGDTVRIRQVIGSVESLKVPNDVEAPAAGTISNVFVAEGQGIEYGQILMTLAPGPA